MNRLLCFLLTSISLSGHAATVSTFDVLVATNYLTVTGTTTVQGSAFSVGESTLVAIGGNIAIGTTTPRDRFHGWGSQLGGGGRSQFIWFSSSASLRIGAATGTQWDNANVGALSIGLGLDNKITGQYSSILGGWLNESLGNLAVIGGGFGNDVDTEGATVSGGEVNVAGNIGATVSGGANNTATGSFSWIGGGRYNIADGNNSVVPGGLSNTANGDESFAAGSEANANHEGAFVWADSSCSGSCPLNSAAPNEVRFRAVGGYALTGSTFAPTILVSSGSFLISTSSTSATSSPNLYISSSTGNIGVGNQLPTTKLDVSGDLKASSAAFTATGSTIYTLTSSSGLHMLNGRIKLEPGAFIEWADNTTSTTAVTASGGGGSNSGPSWTKYTKTYADFAAAATSSTSTLVTVAAGTIIHGVKIKHSTKFSGSGITGYTISVGTGPGNFASSVYASAFDVFQVVKSTAFQLSQNFSAEESTTTWSISANATSVGANLSSASAGSVDIWLLQSVTP